MSKPKIKTKTSKPVLVLVHRYMQQHTTSGNVVGPHAVDTRKNNGECLIDFYFLNNLVISNTFFQHKPIRQKRWMHPGSKTWHMLNYTLINKQFRTNFGNVRVRRTAADAIGTGQQLVRIKLKVHLKSRKRVVKSQLLRIDRKKLKNEQYKLASQVQLNNRPQQQHIYQLDK